MHLRFYLVDEHVSAVEDVPDGSSQCTPAFDAEIKGALQITNKLHLNVHMVVSLLV